MKYLLITLLLVAGCMEPISNDEIISETKKCEDAGMDATVYHNGLTLQPERVECVPRKRATK